MNSQIIKIIQEILQNDKIEFNCVAKGTYSNYYVDTSLNFGLKIFFDESPREGIKEITNKASSLGISNKIYEVSEKFKFILMEHLNGYQRISDSKIIKNPSKKDKRYLKKVLQYWVKMSEIEISHSDIYSYNVMVNHENDDVKLIDFDEYKLGNRYVLTEYLKDDRFIEFLFYSLLNGDTLDDLKEENLRNLLLKREEIFCDLIAKSKSQLGRDTVNKKIMKISQSTVDSTVNEILDDIKNCFINF